MDPYKAAVSVDDDYTGVGVGGTTYAARGQILMSGNVMAQVLRTLETIAASCLKNSSYLVYELFSCPSLL